MKISPPLSEKSCPQTNKLMHDRILLCESNNNNIIFNIKSYTKYIQCYEIEIEENKVKKCAKLNVKYHLNKHYVKKNRPISTIIMIA